MGKFSFLIGTVLVCSSARAQTDDAIYYLNPDWSPDSQKIAFESGHDGALSIHTISLDGKTQQKLTDDENNDEGPVWSPDGERIAFFSNRRYNRDEMPFSLQIYVMKADGTDQRRITSDGDSLDYNVTWSPDGNQLVFQSRPEIDPGVHSLYTIGTDGKGRKRITDGRFDDQSPQWSPDGDRILFLRKRALYEFFGHQSSEERSEARASAEIMLLNMEDGSVTPVTENELREVDPSWNADGSAIYYLQFAVNGKKTFFQQTPGEDGAVAIADGDLVSNDRLPYKTRVSPDGRYLAYHKSIDGTHGIYLYDLAHKEERLLVGDGSRRD